MTSFGTEEDYQKFKEKYGQDPLLSKTKIGLGKKNSGLGGGIGIDVGGIAACVHPVISGKCKPGKSFIGGGGGSPTVGGSGSGAGGVASGTSAGTTTLAFNPYFFKPQDPDIDPNWGVDPKSPMHPIRKKFDEALEKGILKGIQKIAEEIGKRISWFGGPVVKAFIETLKVTETGKDGTVSISYNQLKDEHGNPIGTLTITVDSDGRETHSIMDTKGRYFKFDDRSNDQSRRADLQEFREWYKNEGDYVTEKNEISPNDKESAEETDTKESEDQKPDEGEKEGPSDNDTDGDGAEMVLASITHEQQSVYFILDEDLVIVV